MQPSGYSRAMQVRALTFISVLALISGAAAPACLAQPRTLNWFAKASAKSYAPPEPMAASTPAPGQPSAGLTPPSPYGTVGDPFVRRLNWQSKHAIAPSYARPIPQDTVPQNIAPAPVVYVPQPEPVRRPSVIMPSVAPAPAMPLDISPPPQVAPQAAPKATKPVSAPAADPPSEPRRDGAYQIPPTSKYYRGTRDEPAPATSHAPQATEDRGFTPGEVMTDPRTQSPRVYSMHRQYGLQPDAISSIDDNAPKPESAPSAKP